MTDNPATEERAAAEAAPAPWEFPESLERFREYIVNTGGNPAEELVRDLDAPGVQHLRYRVRSEG